jgi:diketogulonate reductase-like aldo/keto reductase
LKENFDSWSFELAEEDVKKLKALNRNLRICDMKNFFGQEIDPFD